MIQVSISDCDLQLAWNAAGRVLIRALRVANDTNNVDQAIILQAEISFVQYVACWFVLFLWLTDL